MFKDLRIAQLWAESQKHLSMALSELNVVAESLEDLRPAEFSTTHQFGLTSIYFIPRCLPSLLVNVVEKEIAKMLSGGIITPAKSAWAFPIVVVTKQMEILVCLLIIAH